MSDQWRTWITKACLAAGAVFGIGMLLLGLPGAVLLEMVAPKTPPDSAWPLALTITQAAALIVVPASIVLRLIAPAMAGWRHATATALLTVVATLLLAVYLTR